MLLQGRALGLSVPSVHSLSQNIRSLGDVIFPFKLYFKTHIIYIIIYAIAQALFTSIVGTINRVRCELPPSAAIDRTKNIAQGSLDKHESRPSTSGFNTHS